MTTFGDWVTVALIIAAMTAVWQLNNLYSAWLRRNFPWLFRPMALAAILAILILFVIILLVGPPVDEIIAQTTFAIMCVAVIGLLIWRKWSQPR